MLPLCEPHILGLEPYVAGKSIEACKQEYGLKQIIKLASNENPLGTSENALREAKNALSQSHIYPTSHREELKKNILSYTNEPGLSIKNIILGNGSNDLIMLLCRTFVSKQESVAYLWPSFIMYPISTQMLGLQKTPILLNPHFLISPENVVKQIKESKNPVKIFFLSNPNNPIGTYYSKDWVDDFIKQAPKDMIIVVDEAYHEYVEAQDYDTCIPYVLQRPRTVVLRTFSKIYGLAGLRAGYGICSEEMGELMHRTRDPFNINHIAQVAAIHALKDQEHVKKSRLNNQSQKHQLEMFLEQNHIHHIKSQGNFILIKLPQPLTGQDVFFQMLQKGIIIRPVSNYGLDSFIRVSLGIPQEMEKFQTVFLDVLGH